MSEVLHIPRFLSEKYSSELFNFLQSNVRWEVWALSPKSRLVSRYTENIPEIVENVITAIEQAFDTKIMRQVFMNIYKNGEDYCPYHADQYGVNTYTISLGATRDFLLKPNEPGIPAQKFTLESGDLYLMEKDIHRTHKHSVPKRKNLNSPRISMLFFEEY